MIVIMLMNIHDKQKTGHLEGANNICQRYVKRVVDMLIALFCLVLFSPLFVILGLLVAFSDGRPVIFSQERIGYKGKPFRIYKFRTMCQNAEDDDNPQLAETDDPRLTDVGRFLRAHHLDELPQLWNVFIGDMAFVGPRPERKYFIDQIMLHDSRYDQLYQLRPGVTSYATLYNGYTDTMAKMLRRLELDLYYLEHQSLGFDATILWRTFVSIAFGKKF